MNKLSKFTLIPAILLAVIFLSANLNVNQQAYAADTANSNPPQNVPQFNPAFLPLFTQNPPNPLQIQPPLPCYGPHLIANVSKTQVNINETITATGMICPPAPNQTVEVTFVRPDYTYINKRALADDETGEFSANQTLDMAGFWNIFFLHNHITDRLFVNVTDPAGTSPPSVAHQYPPPQDSDYILPIGIAAIGTGIAVLAFAVLRKDKTRKISSLRLFIQITFVILIFTGIFINMPRLPLIPNSEIAQHEYLIGTDIVNGPLPDGLPIPAFACYYACGRTVICPLWQIQTYIYPFWNTGHGWAVNYDTSGIGRIGLYSQPS